MMLEPWRDAAFYQTTKPIQTFIYYPFTQTFENQCRFTLTTNLFLGKYSNTHKHGEKKTNVHTHIHIIKYVKCNHRMHKAKSLWERHFWIIYNVNISDNWEIEFALLNSVRDTDQLQRWWLVMRTVKWEIWPLSTCTCLCWREHLSWNSRIQSLQMNKLHQLSVAIKMMIRINGSYLHMNPLADLNKKNKQTSNCSIFLAYITTYDCVFIHIYSTCLQAV